MAVGVPLEGRFWGVRIPRFGCPKGPPGGVFLGVPEGPKNPPPEGSPRGAPGRGPGGGPRGGGGAHFGGYLITLPFGTN